MSVACRGAVSCEGHADGEGQASTVMFQPRDEEDLPRRDISAAVRAATSALIACAGAGQRMPLRTHVGKDLVQLEST